MKKLCLGLLVLISILLTGCSSTKIVNYPQQYGSYYQKNYVVGQERNISVGEKLLEVSGAHNAVFTDYPMFVSQDDVEITALAGNGLAIIRRGEKLVAKQKVVGQQEQYILEIPRQNRLQNAQLATYAYLNKETLLLENKITQGFNFPARIKNNTAFKDGGRMVLPLNPKDGVNFDIVYNGVSGDTLRFRYREFTNNDMARESFYQDLTYDRSDKTIRFRGIEIEILRVGNGEIVYKVIRDGMESTIR